MLRSFVRGVFAFFLLVVSFSSFNLYAEELNSQRFDIYYGDANDDGQSDIYFHPKELIILLHGDVVTPVVLPKPTGFFISNAEYEGYASIFPLELTDQDISARSLVLASEGVDYFFGNFDEGNAPDVIVRGQNNDSIAFKLIADSSSPLPILASVFEASSTPAGFQLSNRSHEYRVEDLDGDGVDDLVSYSGTAAYFGFLSSTDNHAFSEGSEFRFAMAEPAVGAMKGAHSSAGDGSATYSMPITFPVGIAGMQPNMAISYSSNNGSGHVGVGFNLGGLSGITRCRTNYETDGFLDEVDFDENDRFCLDGEPLVAVNGIYGKNGTEYRTQSETFQKIISYGSVGNCVRNGVNVKGPERFKVWHPTGVVREYGYTQDSRVEATGCTDVVRWAINEEKDRYDNSVTYKYFEGNKDHYVTSISYNGGESQVTFDYIDREDNYESYYAGSVSQQSKLLNRISVSEGQALLREYHLEYELIGSSSISRLTDITECSATACLPKTSFTWSEGSTASSISFGDRIATSICSNLSTNDNRCNDEDNYNQIHYPDVNGDAHSDMCVRGDWGITCRLGTSRGFTGNRIVTNICANDSTEYGQCNDEDNFDTIRFLDINGDGKDDLVYRSDAGIRVMRSTGGSFVSHIESDICSNSSNEYGICDTEDNYRYISFPDVNGDSLPDLCFRGDQGVQCLIGTGDSFSGEHISTTICSNGSNAEGVCNDENNYRTINFADINGDGLSDLVVRTDKGIRVWRSTGIGFESHFTTTLCADYSEENGVCNDDDNIYTINYPDINGDGVADICYRGDQGIHCSIGTGYGWTGGDIVTDICANGSSEVDGVCNDNDNYRTINYVDINQDGRQDIIYRSDNGIYAYKSTGDGFEELFHRQDICANGSTQNGVCDQEDNFDTINIIDFNGDGIPDLAYRGDEGIQLFPILVDQRNHLTQITNGLGLQTKFTYKYMTDSSVYTRGSEAVSFPVQHSISARKLLSKVEISDGLGGFNGVSYRYSGQKFHRTGRGSLGFKKVVMTNDDSGITTASTYSQDYASRFEGKELAVVTTAANGTVLMNSNNEWLLQTWGSGEQYRYKVQSSGGEVIERDLSGAFLKKWCLVRSSITRIVNQPLFAKVYIAQIILMQLH